MVNRVNKKLLLIAGVFVLAIAFAACGGNGNDAPPAPAGEQGGQAVAATEAPATVDAPADHDPRAYQPVPAGDWNTPFPYPVHFTIGSTLGTNWNFQGGDTTNDSPWTRLLRDELNIHVEWTILESVDYPLALQLAIAADNLPDVFYIPMSIQRTFNQLQEAGTLLDLTHAYNNYTSQRIRDRELVDPLTIQTYTVDGRIYALPRYYYGQIDQPWHMWLRKDWHEAEGSPEIRTVEDLENLARAFMTNHGAQYGIHTDNNLQFLFRTAPMFGAYIGNVHDSAYFWLPDETGRLRPGIASPEFVTALETWQRWYAEGLLNPDFMSVGPWDRAQEDVINGLVGIMPWWQWWGWSMGGSIVQIQNLDAYFVPHNLPTVDGSRPARGQIFFPNTGILAANRTFQNPGAYMMALSMVDHMIFSPDANLTPEQLDYFMFDNREHAMSPALKMIDPHADMMQFIYINRALETGDSSPLFTAGMLQKYAEIQNWLTDPAGSPGALGPFLQLGFPNSAYGRSQHLFDQGLVVENRMWGPPPAAFDDAGLTGEMIIEEVTLIIMGINPVSHFTDVVLPNWYAQGGQVKEDAVNAYFN